MPDTRGWAMVGLFALAFFIFALIGIDHTIANVQLFGVLATAVISGGLGGALGFYFGSSKGSADKDAVVAEAVSKSPDASQ